MKTALKLSLFYVMASFLLAGCATNRSMAGTISPEYTAAAPVSIDIFYQSLSPYGRWISYPQYGQVWIPNVGRSFEPYSTNGNWVYTNYGWTWASNYSWGWAPFHYGRWLFDDYYGWVWVPGTEWAPAWVAWRNSSDYYGWAPLGPGVNISINIGIPAARWIFVPRHYFGNPYAYRYYVPRQRNVYIINNTTIIHNTNIYQNNRYFAGPARGEVERATNRSIRPVRVFNSERPGATQVNNRQLSIYRPTVERSAGDNARTTAPAASTTRNRPERTANGRQATPASPQNAENRNGNTPNRVFRGQETDRTNTSPNLNQPMRSRPSTTAPESRQTAPAQRENTSRPAATPQQRSPRVFRQESSPAPAVRQPKQRAIRNTPRSERIQRESRSSSPRQERQANTNRSSSRPSRGR